MEFDKPHAQIGNFNEVGQGVDERACDDARSQQSGNNDFDRVNPSELFEIARQRVDFIVMRDAKIPAGQCDPCQVEFLRWRFVAMFGAAMAEMAYDRLLSETTVRLFLDEVCGDARSAVADHSDVDADSCQPIELPFRTDIVAIPADDVAVAVEKALGDGWTARVVDTDRLELRHPGMSEEVETVQ